MSGTHNSSRSLFKIVMVVLFVHLLARMVLSDGHIYGLGHSYGKELREKDAGLDLKDLDQEINEFEESLGADQRLIGKLVNGNFREGVQHGYYWPEYQEEVLEDV